MLFNSLEYLFFFPVVAAAYYALPARHRWFFLLAASYYFYACWKVEYLILIILSTVVDYWAGIQMGRRTSRRKRRPFLVLSICTNIGILFSFKYFNFVNESVRSTLSYIDVFYDIPAFDALLPVGISFYTFQTLAYSIDVYRGKAEYETHLGIFALYVSFFPQLVAGPIERSQRLIPQFHVGRSFCYDRVVSGLRVALWGFFLKLVIADRLGLYVDEVYSDIHGYYGIQLILATYFFAFQIYCDFAGYSLIAIGSARAMGVELMDNFKQPYLARSIGEFWRRWHISLSTWFRDYLYIPLGGNRTSRNKWILSILIVFVVSGLWHGAAWTFVLWGALHGVYLVAGAITRPWRDSVWDRVSSTVTAVSCKLLPFEKPLSLTGIRHVLAVLTTFHLVLVSWVFFRAEKIFDAFDVFTRALGKEAFSLSLLEQSDFGRYQMSLSVVLIGVLLAIDVCDNRNSIWERLKAAPVAGRWAIYVLIILLIIALGEFGATAFIYFQF